MGRQVFKVKQLLTFWLLISPIIAQQLPNNGMVPPGQIPQNMMPQPEPQAVDPTLLKKIEQYEKLIEKYPDNTDLHYNLGNLKYLAGNHEEAINDYRKNLSTLDEKKKSHALYNIGNSYFSQGKYQESADFYKKAMQSNPNDEDMKINYELTRRMLQQQQQQSQQSDNDKNEDKEEQQQEQQEQEKQQSENQDGEKKESGEEQEAQENQQEPEQKPGDEESQKEEQQRLKEMSEEKQLAKEEAEAILNALKASQENLMKKKYVVKNRQKLEKDW